MTNIIEVNMPYKYKPRPYQMPIWEYWMNGGKRMCWVCHRRGGKDLTSVNILATAAVQRVGLYWHLFPTFEQGRKVAWNGKTKDGDSFLDAIPEPLIQRIDNTRMMVELKNGSTYSVVGADEPDRLVGSNPIGIIFSEWSIMNPQAWEFIRPILMENDGFAIFVYTPRGRNHGYELYEMAKTNPNWFAMLQTIDDTKAISLSVIDEERAQGMPEELVQQEFWCSFDASLAGSYFGQQMTEARNEGRIKEHLPIDPAIPVDTFWDIGINDETVIWFIQRGRGENRVIDFYSNNGEGLDHYVQVLHKKAYLYGDHWGPHDLAVREFTSGVSRIETARNLGIRFKIVPKLSREDGINVTRMVLRNCWFDETKCKHGIRALQEYSKSYDEKNKVYRNTPHHNWASHPADAFRQFGVAGKQVPLGGFKQTNSDKAILEYNMFDL